jgi:ribosomal protein S14
MSRQTVREALLGGKLPGIQWLPQKQPAVH